MTLSAKLMLTFTIIWHTSGHFAFVMIAGAGGKSSNVSCITLECINPDTKIARCPDPLFIDGESSSGCTDNQVKYTCCDPRRPKDASEKASCIQLECINPDTKIARCPDPLFIDGESTSGCTDNQVKYTCCDPRRPEDGSTTNKDRGNSKNGKPDYCVVTKCQNKLTYNLKCHPSMYEQGFTEDGCRNGLARYTCCGSEKPKNPFKSKKIDVGERCVITECKNVLTKEAKCKYPFRVRGYTKAGCPKNQGKYSCCGGFGHGLRPNFNKGTRICALTECKSIKSKEAKCKSGVFPYGMVKGKCSADQAQFRCCRYGGVLVPLSPLYSKAKSGGTGKDDKKRKGNSGPSAANDGDEMKDGDGTSDGAASQPKDENEVDPDEKNEGSKLDESLAKKRSDDDVATSQPKDGNEVGPDETEKSEGSKIDESSTKKSSDDDVATSQPKDGNEVDPVETEKSEGSKIDESSTKTSSDDDVATSQPKDGNEVDPDETEKSEGSKIDESSTKKSSDDGVATSQPKDGNEVDPDETEKSEGNKIDESSAKKSSDDEDGISSQPDGGTNLNKEPGSPDGDKLGDKDGEGNENPTDGENAGSSQPDGEINLKKELPSKPSKCKATNCKKPEDPKECPSSDMKVMGVEVDGSCAEGEVKYRCCSGLASPDGKDEGAKEENPVEKAQVEEDQVEEDQVKKVQEVEEDQVEEKDANQIGGNGGGTTGDGGDQIGENDSKLNEKGEKCTTGKCIPKSTKDPCPNGRMVMWMNEEKCENGMAMAGCCFVAA